VKKAQNIFLLSAGVLLLLTAVAKFVSASGTASVLQSKDPVLAVTFQQMFWGAGLLELGVAAICLVGRPIIMRAGLVAWLCGVFVAYRVAMAWLGYQRPCSCLGTVTDALHIRPETADTLMKGVLGYLLTGSGVILLLAWREKWQFPEGGVRVPVATNDANA